MCLKLQLWIFSVQFRFLKQPDALKRRVKWHPMHLYASRRSLICFVGCKCTYLSVVDLFRGLQVRLSILSVGRLSNFAPISCLNKARRTFI